MTDKLAIYKDFTAEPNQPLQPQLTALFRRLLMCGALHVGDRLPPLQQLADLFETNYFTVNAALKTLVEENLLERRPRIGTFVRAAQALPTRVGIYTHISKQAHPEDSIFVHLAISAISARLDAADIRCELFVDERTLQEQNTPLPRLETAVRSGRVQQLILLNSGYSARRWLTAFGMPTVSANYYPNTFSLIQNLPEIAIAAAKCLKKRGCRRAALITGVTPNSLDPWHKRFHDMFTDALKAEGIAYDPQQIIAPRDSLGHSRAAFGYHMCNWLLGMDEQPDGLFVYPDSIAPGVISALVAAGVRNLHLVIGKNKEQGLFLPFPADLLEFSVADFADALLGELAAAVRREEPALNYWPFEIRENVSSIRPQIASPKEA